ncbi:MAG: hypothetical protein KAS39_02390, partial [Actinomycetia bacterium]|nr:hypothetical protein [Actinomycetes bacterium]
MILSMAKVEIIGPKKHLYDVLAFVHQLGILHLEDISKKIVPGDMTVRRMEVDDEKDERRKELESLLVKVNSILSAVAPTEKKVISKEKKKEFYEKYWKKDLGNLKLEVDEIVDKLEEKTRTLASRKNELELELATLSKYNTIIEKIQPLAKQLVALEGFESVALLVEKKYKSVLDIIRDEAKRITKNQFEIVSTDVDEETTAALLIFNKTFSEPIHSFLWAENVNQVRLPDEFAEKPFDEARGLLREKQEKIPKEIKEIKEELSKISSEWYERLSTISEVIKDRCSEMEVVYKLGQTDYTFVIEGWMPKKHINKTQKSLNNEFGKRVIISQSEVTEHELEEAPVVLENPKWAQPFELILDFFSKPRYGTLD